MGEGGVVRGRGVTGEAGEFPKIAISFRRGANFGYLVLDPVLDTLLDALLEASWERFPKIAPLYSGIAIRVILAKANHFGRRCANGRFVPTKRSLVGLGKDCVCSVFCFSKIDLPRFPRIFCKSSNGKKSGDQSRRKMFMFAVFYSLREPLRERFVSTKWAPVRGLSKCSKHQNL